MHLPAGCGDSVAAEYGQGHRSSTLPTDERRQRQLYRTEAELSSSPGRLAQIHHRPATSKMEQDEFSDRFEGVECSEPT